MSIFSRLFQSFFSKFSTPEKNIAAIFYEVRNSKRFDRRYLDDKIAKITQHIKIKKCNPNPHRIAFLSTALFDQSGQAKCLLSITKVLNHTYEQAIFLTALKKAEHDAPKTIKELKKYLFMLGINCVSERFVDNVTFLTNKIMDFAPKVIIASMNPHDIFATAILSLIRKNTNIKILYFNQASHWPLLGASFAHFIIEASPLTARITIERRHMNNYKIIPLPSLEQGETIYYTQSQIQKLKKDLNILQDALVSLSGGTAYNFFDAQNNSEYFQMIKNLLLREKKLYHIVMSNFSRGHIKAISMIFGNDYLKLKERLILMPRKDNFDIYFQMADVFIDSFPISSALTQMDLMRNKVASIVKINDKNPMHSFHEYQMPGYPYMYTCVSDMENAILKLLHDKNARKKIVEKNYKYWLSKYEANVVAQKYIQLIEEV